MAGGGVCSFSAGFVGMVMKPYYGSIMQAESCKVRSVCPKLRSCDATSAVVDSLLGLWWFQLFAELRWE